MSVGVMKLGDIANLSTGKLDSNAATEGGAYPFFTCDPTTLAIDNYAFDTEAVLLAGNNASGNFTAKYFKGKFNAYQRTYVITTKDRDVLLTSYLHYALNMSLLSLKSQSAGSTTKYLTKTILNSLPIPVPSIDSQQRIVEILSSFDSLIENNRRQIALLEEAAQRLYKEWFVDLRFPGHESVEIVDGVPCGWNNVSVNELFEYHDSKRIPLSGAEREKIQGTYPYYGAAACLDYVNDYLFDGVYLLLGEDGTVITDEGTPMLQYVWGKFWVNNHAHILTGNEPFTTEYLFCMFRNMYIGDVVTGAAQPKISQKRLNNKITLRPESDLVEQFCKVIAPMFDRIRCLKNQIDASREARDRLLPKLMFGEIEVEG